MSTKRWIAWRGWLHGCSAALLWGCAHTGSHTSSLATLASLDAIPARNMPRTIGEWEGLVRAMRARAHFVVAAGDPRRAAEVERLADSLVELGHGVRARAVAIDEQAGAVPAPPDTAVTQRANTSPYAPFVVPPRASSDLLLVRSTARTALEASDRLLAEAINTYGELLAQFPSYAHDDRALEMRARLFGELGQQAMALQQAALLLNAYPSSPRVAFADIIFADHFFELRRYQEAQAFYESVAQGGVPELVARAEYRIAWTLLNLQQTAAALRRLPVAARAARAHGEATTLAAINADVPAFLVTGFQPIRTAEVVQLVAQIADDDNAVIDRTLLSTATQLRQESRPTEAIELLRELARRDRAHACEYERMSADVAEGADGASGAPPTPVASQCRAP